MGGWTDEWKIPKFRPNKGTCPSDSCLVPEEERTFRRNWIDYLLPDDKKEAKNRNSST